MNRPPFLRGFAALAGALVIDLFAGGGGASTGIEDALQRPVDFAINHSPEAIAMHRENHPETRHFCEDVFDVDPATVACGRPIGLLWASPECTNHSRAKGGKPRDDQSRTTARVILRWASLPAPSKPQTIVIENVEEWLKWGPLDEGGYPIKGREGEDFRAWCAALVDLGYRIEFRTLVAADYGAPTTRKRLFLIARSDGGSLAFPAASHGKGRSETWRPASEIIDWSVFCPSIFDRERPLVDATMRRIAAGVQRFVLETPDPFIAPGFVPCLIQTGYGERRGQTPRALDLGRPLGMVVAGGAKHALVAAFLSKHYGGPNGHVTPGSSARAPLGTVTTQDHNALSVARLTAAPSQRTEAVRAFLIKYYGSSGRAQGQSCSSPLGTVTTRDRFGLVTVHGQDYQIDDIGMRMLAPRELFRAQSFPDWYKIDPVFNGKPLKKTAQIALAGNSVCPVIAAAIVRQIIGANDNARRAFGQLSIFDMVG